MNRTTTSPAGPLLTPQQRESLYETGFCITGTIFEPAAIAELRASIDEVWQHQIAKTDPADAVASRNIRERPFLSGYHRLSPVGRHLLRRPPLTDLARQLIGGDVDVPNDQIVIKPPMKSWNNTFAWHQDDHYIKDNHHWNVPIVSDLRRCYQCWLALTPTTTQNGTLWVLPGWHRRGLLPHHYSEATAEWVMTGELPEAHAPGSAPGHYYASAPGQTGPAVPVELQPGQMLIFSGLLPHTSGPNTTPDQTRIVYQFTYTQTGGAMGDFVLPILRDGHVVES